MLKNKFLLCVIVALSLIAKKSKFLEQLLPQKLLKKLPLGWTDEMYWTVLKSRGQKVYVDIPCQLKQPQTYEPKIDVENTYKLTEAEIQFFYQNGYLGPFTLMSSTEASLLWQHLQEILKKESTVYPYSQGAYIIEAQDRFSSKDGVRSNYETSLLAMNYRDRHLEDDVLLSLFKHSALTERCAQLLGSDLLLWRTQFFPKAPGEAGTPLHQASSYLLDNMKAPVVYPPDRSELFQLTCWIALTKATKENGCMTVVKGSQKEIHPLKVSRPFDTKSDQDESQRFVTAKIEVDYAVNLEDVIPIEMDAGQFFIFSERALHGSLCNQTDRWRWAVNGRIVRPDTRLYTQEMLTKGHSHRVIGVSQICLDNWQAISIRGQDTFSYNRLREDNSGEDKNIDTGSAKNLEIAFKI
ncbi:MAG: phytanoyl-CoA dioxygenase family protein [Chroococcidiopsidaceae cyanobacterium CP_BM_ER_R8_30]|nr:phytanoyl-CoA dioxygenase family protein [Chroococcidiopsidaceae cyanobacterium CP_BM_ER_R8_30]